MSKANDLLDLKDKLDMSITDIKTITFLLSHYVEQCEDPILENSFHLLSEKIEEAKMNADTFYQVTKNKAA